MDSLQGQYGTCYIGDCIEGLTQLHLSPKHFDLTLTDLPYNIDTKQTKGRGVIVPKRYVEIYNDHKDNAEYYAWCRFWFETMMPLTTKLIFTCGKTNIGFWTWFFQHELYDYNIWQLNNSPSRGFATEWIYFEPLLFFGTFTQKEKWKNNSQPHGNPFYYQCNTGISKNREFAKFHLANPQPSYQVKHPHPKPFEMYLDLINHYHPKLACDPCVGSGMAIRIFELLHIHWIAFENDPKFIPDIEWNINVGKTNPDFYKRFDHKKITLDNFK